MLSTLYPRGRALNRAVGRKPTERGKNTGKFSRNKKGGTNPAFVEMLKRCSFSSVHIGRITATEADARIKEEAVIERTSGRLAIKRWIAIDVGAAIERAGVAVGID